MKTVKLLFMIAALPAVIFLNTGCDGRWGETELEPYKKCLDNCDEKRDRIDEEYLLCTHDALAQFIEKLENCPSKASVFDSRMAVQIKVLNDKIAQCILQKKEDTEEVEICKDLCYKDAVNRKLE